MVYYYKKVRVNLKAGRRKMFYGVTSAKPSYSKLEIDGGYILTLPATKEEVKAYYKDSRNQMIDFNAFNGIRRLDHNVYFGDFLSVVHCLQLNRSQRKHIEAMEALAKANAMRIAY